MIDDRPRYWHISGVWLLLLAPIVIPAAIVAGLFSRGKTEARRAEHVVLYLREFLDGAGGEWDWDDFTSVPITDPELEAIRRRAEMVKLPLTPEGRATLEGLLREAEALR